MGFFFDILGMDRSKTMEMLSAPRSGFSGLKASGAESRDMTESKTIGKAMIKLTASSKIRKGGSP